MLSFLLGITFNTTIALCFAELRILVFRELHIKLRKACQTQAFPMFKYLHILNVYVASEERVCKPSQFITIALCGNWTMKSVIPFGVSSLSFSISRLLLWNLWCEYVASVCWNKRPRKIYVSRCSHTHTMKLESFHVRFTILFVRCVFHQNKRQTCVGFFAINGNFDVIENNIRMLYCCLFEKGR